MTIAREDQYIALPCSGRKALGIKRGHVYSIRDLGRKEVGYMTLEEVQEKFGILPEKIFVSTSDTLCDDCFRIINEVKK